MSRILAADDNKMVRMFYEGVLTYLGQDYEICKNGKEALDAFKRQAADLVILDYDMPEMNGFEACKAIRNTAEGVLVPIVIVSSHDDEEHISKGLDAGANDYLNKPVKEAHLIAKLKNYLKISAFHKGECDLIKTHAVISGRYRVERLLGCGSHSTVFLVSDTQDNEKQLALKLLNETASSGDIAKSFFEVAARVKELQSDFVARITDMGQFGGRAYAVMEYLDGGDLAGLLKKRKKLTEPETLKMALDVARGLEAFHAVGLIHLDLKPENILRDSASGRFKLADFGIITMRSTATMPLNTEIWSTLAYVPPEYFKEDAEVSTVSDIYSLGVTIYQCLTGDNPFLCERPAVTMFRHINFQPPLLKSCDAYISEEISQLTAQMLDKSMDTRPDAKSCVESLEDIIKNPASHDKKLKEVAAASKIAEVREAISLDKVKEEVRSDRKVRTNIEKADKRKSMSFALALTISVTLVCCAIGYYLNRLMFTVEAPAGALLATACTKCGVLDARRTPDISKEHCQKCKGKLGYAMSCKSCKKIFPYLLIDMSGIKDKALMIAKIEESRKCPSCGSRDTESLRPKPPEAPSKAPTPKSR